ncbi:MAG: hypothetical protein GEU28_09975 [Dehalococcoidia bacterium]|nr:hypothetical protein [Dehalococcoidia bacterium]
MTLSPQTSPRNRLPWLIVMVLSMLAAIAAAATLVYLLLDQDDGEDFIRPVIEFSNISEGDTLPLEEQIITVRATHDTGIDSIRFFLSGGDQVFDSDTGGAVEIEASFPFMPGEPGQYTLVAEAIAVDGTASDQLQISVTVADDGAGSSASALR